MSGSGIKIEKENKNNMAYSRISYKDFSPYKMERVGRSGIKKIVWDKIVSQEEIENFIPHLTDERTKILIQKTTSMPFDVYIVPANEVWKWGEFIREQSGLKQIFNCVYLLWGHDFIYAGKSVNGDRILGHIADEAKSDFDFQMLFVPNNDNPYTMTNWTSDFMSYIEALMIGRLMDNNTFCKNKIAGKNITKSQRDLNLNADKEEFADNIVELIFDVFLDVTYCSYLVPELPRQTLSEQEDCKNIDSEDEGMLMLWNDIFSLSDNSSRFSKLKPQRGNYIYCNLNAEKLIANSTIGCVLNQSTCRVEFTGWGDIHSADINLRNFDLLRQHKEDIESEFGCQLKWERKDDKYTTRISVSKSLSYKDRSNGSLRDIADFFSEYFDKFYSILPKYCSFEQDSSEQAEEYDIDR